jgi:hypothetical protein
VRGQLDAGTMDRLSDNGTSRKLDSVTLGQRDTGETSGQGSMGLSDIGTLGQWDNGTMGQWTLGRWDICTVGQWDNDPVGQSCLPHLPSPHR